MSHELITFLAIWRMAWYAILIYFSVRNQKLLDGILGVVLLLLAAIVAPSTRPIVALGAFVVAPLITITIIRYQSR